MATEIDTPERLRFHADRMEAEGHLNAARHMRNGADEIEHLRQRLRCTETALRNAQQAYSDSLWAPGTYQNGA